MGEDLDAFGAGAGQDPRHLLDLDARDERAVEVVDIARAPSRPTPR